tara:strand:- start:414 stop:941 length:528 start_codon:yes stop_codon:yes gene_type:complete
MAIAIDATVGSAAANSFVTLAEADSYMEGRLNSTLWDAATDDSKNRSLVEATRYLSALEWTGDRVDSTQSLAWPRQNAYDPDSPIYDYFGTTVIPARIDRGTYELANEFIKAGTTDVAGLDPSAEIKREKVDVLETEYTDAHARPEGLERYPSVTREINPLFANSSRAVGEVWKG